MHPETKVSSAGQLAHLDTCAIRLRRLLWCGEAALLSRDCLDDLLKPSGHTTHWVVLACL